MNEKFTVTDENGIKNEAEVLTVFEYKNKDYIVYSIDADEDNSNIYVSRLVKDSEGYDKIEDINDETEKSEVQKVVNEMLDAVEN